MAVSFATSLRNAMLDQITAAIGSNGLFRVYDGTPPASVNDALSGNTLLAELACSATFAAAAASGSLAVNAISDDTSANATGTATFYRITTSGGTAKIQGLVGTVSGDAIINTTSILAGGLVAVVSMNIASANA